MEQETSGTPIARSIAQALARTLICLILLSALFAPGVALAQSNDDQLQQLEARPLKGITTIYCMVNVGKDATNAGISADDLKTKIELRLREAGITVTDKIMETATVNGAQVQIATPALMLDVDTITNSDAIIFDITLHLVESVQLERDPTIKTDCDTWSTGQFGGSSPDHLPPISRDVDKDMDQFLNDYLSVNPKPSSAAAGIKPAAPKRAPGA